MVSGPPAIEPNVPTVSPPHHEESHAVHCLCIDLIGSTEAGVAMPTSRFHKFVVRLAKYLYPIIEDLGLGGSVVKFEGDGWLVFTHHMDQVPALCCLAHIVARKLQADVAQDTGMQPGEVPAPRQSICQGRDLAVVLPDRHEDWVGDSARRASRSSACCEPNEIIVDEATRGLIFRDFQTQPVELDALPDEGRPKHDEERLVLHRLGDLKPEAGQDSDAPECYVYTLRVLGDTAQAEALVMHATEEIKSKLIPGRPSDSGNVRPWNRLLRACPDYTAGRAVMDKMRGAGIGPAATTYNILMSKAPDHETARSCLTEMQAEGIEPDAVTYNTLISKAPDHETAKGWRDVMQAKGIPLDIVAYKALVAVRRPRVERPKAVPAPWRNPKAYPPGPERWRQEGKLGDIVGGPGHTHPTMVWVPQDAFRMGSDGAPRDADPSEAPAHQVKITRGFWLSRCLVTNAQYAEYLNERQRVRDDAHLDSIADDDNYWREIHQEGGVWKPIGDRGQFPVVGVDWYSGRAYAAWYGLRLPTEAEWEYAARGEESRVYPADGSLQVDPRGPDPTPGSRRAVKGGNCFYGRDECRASCRQNATYPEYVNNSVGFRCAYTPEHQDAET